MRRRRRGRRRRGEGGKDVGLRRREWERGMGDIRHGRTGDEGTREKSSDALMKTPSSLPECANRVVDPREE